MSDNNQNDNVKFLANGAFFFYLWRDPWFKIGCFCAVVAATYITIENKILQSFTQNGLVNVTFNIKWGESLESFQTHAKINKSYKVDKDTPMSCFLEPTKIGNGVVMTEAYFHNNRLYKAVLKVENDKAIRKIDSRINRYASMWRTEDRFNPSYQAWAGKDKVDVDIRFESLRITLINLTYSPSHGFGYD